MTSTTEKSFLIKLKRVTSQLLKRNLQIKYWGEDQAILEKIYIENAKTQDNEKLHFIAQNSVRSCLNWTAYRLAKKARTELSTIIHETKEIDNQLIEANKPNTELKQPILSVDSEEEYLQSQKKKSESFPQRMRIPYESMQAHPEEGIALNYILEFLHNMQDELKNLPLSEKEVNNIVQSIKKSIPEDTDIIESTLAGALRAVIKRLPLQQKAQTSMAQEETIVVTSLPQLKVTDISQNPKSEHGESTEKNYQKTG